MKFKILLNRIFYQPSNLLTESFKLCSLAQHRPTHGALHVGLCCAKLHTLVMVEATGLISFSAQLQFISSFAFLPTAAVPMLASWFYQSLL